MINQEELNDLKNIIFNNPNIENELKDKIIECATLILKKYPIAYRNLYANLETITIRYTNIIDKVRLEQISADSCYNCNDNLLLLNKERSNSQYYKNIIIHELLHVASFNDLNMGFESLYAKKGLSFNEGMTEFLTREILNDHSFGMTTYNNDVNNVLLLQIIIPSDKLTTLYFTEGLQGLFTAYLNKIGKENNLKELMISMDEEFDTRVRKNKFNNECKDTYIKLFIDDISKIEFNSDAKIINAIEIIVEFIKKQYQSDIVPASIKDSIEKSLSTIFGKLNIGKGKVNG